MNPFGAPGGFDSHARHPIAVSPAPIFAGATGPLPEGSRNSTLTSLAGTMRRIAESSTYDTARG
jgi:hypothetical protein